MTAPGSPSTMQLRQTMVTFNRFPSFVVGLALYTLAALVCLGLLTCPGPMVGLVCALSLAVLAVNRTRNEGQCQIT